MSTVVVPTFVLVLLFPTPIVKLELFVPPLTFKLPPPPIVTAVVTAPRLFGVPIANDALIVEFNPLSVPFPDTFNVEPAPIVSTFTVALFVPDEKLPTLTVAPDATVRFPVDAPAAVPSATLLPAFPRLLPTFTTTDPLLISTGPASPLLSPAKFNVPGPFTATPVLPDSPALIVGLCPPATVTTGEFVSVRLFPPPAIV